jgi:hypothetical protein
MIAARLRTVWAPASVALLVVTATGTIVHRGLDPLRAAAVDAVISTSTDNLASHPFRSLVGSALVATSPAILWLGLTFAALVALELWVGPWRALGAFALGHVGATLLTAPTILWGTAHGWMPMSTRSVSDDYGLSYGCVCCLWILVLRVPRRWRVPYVALLVAFLWSLGVTAAPQDFTATGHLCAAVLGLVVVVVASRSRRTAEIGRASEGSSSSSSD